MRSTGSAKLLTVTLALLLLSVSSASGAVRLGPDLTPVPVSGVVAVGCQSAAQYNPCIFLNHESTNADVPIVAPFSGVITKWRFRGGCCTEPQSVEHTWTLRTLRHGVQTASGYAYNVPIASGPSFVLPPGANVAGDPPVELPARLPIALGDRVGIAADYPISMSVYNSTPGVTGTVLFNGFEYMGEAYGNPLANTALAINADLEHDADGDGFGDETQDCFPADPGQNGGNCNAGLPPHDLPSVGIDCPAGSHCSGQAGGGASFSGVPVQPSGPRSDGGVVITLKCAPEVVGFCGGILYAELPAGKKAQTAAGRRLGSTKYRLNPGAKKKLKIKFSKKTRKFLAKKAKRRIFVTIQPTGAQPLTTRVTLKFKRR